MRTIAKLGLGVGRLGLGCAPASGQGRAALHEAKTAIGVAAKSGVSVLDATVDGAEAQTRLGSALPQPHGFRVSIPAFGGDRGPPGIEEAARASLARLGIERADALLAPSAAELFGTDGAALWKAMRRLKDAGLFDRVGVALTAEEDPVGVARRFKPDLVQLPVSLLDQRLVANGSLDALASLGVDIHLRSIFLQGLLFLPGHGLPPALAAAASGLSRIRRQIAESGADLLQAALAFAFSRPEASAVIANVGSAAELRAIIAAASAPPPVLDWERLALDPIIALDPQQWAAA